MIFIMRGVSTSGRLSGCYRAIFYNPVVAAASRRRGGIQAEGSDRKSHFYDTHCRMSSLFQVKIFTAAHKNSIRHRLLGKPIALQQTRRSRMPSTHLAVNDVQIVIKFESMRATNIVRVLS